MGAPMRRAYSPVAPRCGQHNRLAPIQADPLSRSSERARHRASPFAIRGALLGRCSAVLLGSAVAVGAASADGDIQLVENVNCGIAYDLSGSLLGASLAIGDYDGDGWEDVLLTGGRPAGMRLYRNQGDRTFVDETATALPAGLPWASGVMLLDIDNDGDPDIIFAREANNRAWTGFGCLTNDGGVFSLMNTPLEFAKADGRLGGLAAADLDLDGALDIVKVHYMGVGFVLQNDGAGGFIDATNSMCLGLAAPRNSWSPAFGDYNNDGFQDVHVAIDFDPDVQFRNAGNGELVDVSVEANVTNAGSDMGLAVADMDNDGDLDIYSTNILPHVLYVNDGQGRFTDEAFERGVSRSSVAIGRGWGTEFADLDLDGDFDLVLVDGSVEGAVFENDGAGYFTKIEATGPSDLNAYALAAFDYDHDGDLDLLQAASIGWPRLLENVSPAAAGRHWLGLRLEGTFTNRDGVGARVRVTAGGQRMIREVQCGSSFKTCGSRVQHFGLADSAAAGLVEVLWPSGMVTLLENVAADQTLHLVEPNPDLNHDGAIELGDLQVLLLNFGGVGSVEDGDFNGNGVVDLADLSSLLTAYALFAP